MSPKLTAWEGGLTSAVRIGITFPSLRDSASGYGASRRSAAVRRIYTRCLDRLYLAPQAGDEHIDAAVIGFRATPGNGVTELVTRQDPARTVYEGGQQRGLGAGQPHFPAAAMDKDMAGQVELAVLDFYRRRDSFIALAPWRRHWFAELIEQLLLVESVFGKCICPLKRMARSHDLVGSVPHQDRSWNLIA